MTDKKKEIGVINANTIRNSGNCNSPLNKSGFVHKSPNKSMYKSQKEKENLNKSKRKA